MQAVSIVNVLQNIVPVGAVVTVLGWVRNNRASKAGLSFVTIYDGSAVHPLQAIFNQTLENYQQVLSLTPGCSIAVTGTVVASPAKGQAVELVVGNFRIYGLVEDPGHYPIAAKRHSMEYLREVAHLRPRTNIIGAVARVRHTVANAIHRFFDMNGFFWVATPIITTADCEGGGELFRVSTLDLHHLARSESSEVDFNQDFFGQEAFLTVSGQLNAESYACALSKVYTFGPTFRAENSNTSRHLAEFWMVEPEMAFAELDDIALLAEKMLKFIVAELLKQRADEVDFFSQRVDKELRHRLEKLLESRFISVNYGEAISLLLQSGQSFEHPVSWGCDLASEHERYLTEVIFNAPVVVKNYPKAIKAFYMRANEDGRTVAALDILAPGIGEIIGGSQREERLALLDQQMDERGLNREQYGWYRDLRRYGSVPHSGFGLGFERLLNYLTGVQNVRDVIPFPRTRRSAKF